MEDKVSDSRGVLDRILQDPCNLYLLTSTRGSRSLLRTHSHSCSQAPLHSLQQTEIEFKRDKESHIRLNTSREEGSVNFLFLISIHTYQPVPKHFDPILRLTLITRRLFFAINRSLSNISELRSSIHQDVCPFYSLIPSSSPLYPPIVRSGRPFKPSNNREGGRNRGRVKRRGFSETSQRGWSTGSPLSASRTLSKEICAWNVSGRSDRCRGYTQRRPASSSKHRYVSQATSCFKLNRPVFFITTRCYHHIFCWANQRFYTGDFARLTNCQLDPRFSYCLSSNKLSSYICRIISLSIFGHFQRQIFRHDHPAYSNNHYGADQHSLQWEPFCCYTNHLARWWNTWNNPNWECRRSGKFDTVTRSTNWCGY